jgi:Papain family cysteine protease
MKTMPNKTYDVKDRILNCLPSPEPEMDWGMEAAEGTFMAAAPAALPVSVDLRADWWKVGDQGATGSCVGWGVGDSVVRWHFVKLGRIQAKDLIAVRYIWMAAKETDQFTSRPTTFIESDGTSIKSALDIVRKYGTVLDPLLPFKTLKLYQGGADVFYTTAASLRINAYFNLGRNLFFWRHWLANMGPVVTRLSVDDTWDHASATNGNLDEYHPQTTRGGHAVAFVGYTADRFIVRNSWGENWGDGGFAYASIQYAQDAFTEAYGVYVV